MKTTCNICRMTFEVEDRQYKPGMYQAERHVCPVPGCNRPFCSAENGNGKVKTTMTPEQYQRFTTPPASPLLGRG